MIPESIISPMKGADVNPKVSWIVVVICIRSTTELHLSSRRGYSSHIKFEIIRQTLSIIQEQCQWSLSFRYQSMQKLKQSGQQHNNYRRSPQKKMESLISAIMKFIALILQTYNKVHKAINHNFKIACIIHQVLQQPSINLC